VFTVNYNKFEIEYQGSSNIEFDILVKFAKETVRHNVIRTVIDKCSKRVNFDSSCAFKCCMN